MKSVGSYEAITHLRQLLSQLEKGETITITKHGKPIAVLSPAQPAPHRDVKADT
jgi:prevent-host-death family protein